MGMALVTHRILHNRQRCQSWHHTIHRRKRLNYLAVATRQNTLFIRVSGRMRSDEFKRRLGLSFTVIVLAYNNFLLLLKSFINKTPKYKANLNLKI